MPTSLTAAGRARILEALVPGHQWERVDRHEMRGVENLTDRQPPLSISSTRVSPPRPAAGTIERGRLLERLDAGVRGPLTVVTGPPGAGKTQLLSSWLAASGPARTVAWLAVDRSETRPAEFWGAVIDAVVAAGEARLGSLASRAALSESRFLPEFANAVGGLERPLTLILDDFHELRAPRVSEQLDRLLRHPPEQLAVVIASRADPRLSLHRLRLEGRVAEIRSADLAFTAEEAQSMFVAAGLGLTTIQVQALHSRTEGWAAGLRLAALSLGSGDDADLLIATFNGDERSVADYLVEEVLQHQPDEIRDFMLRTSVVDLMTAELADALTGHADGGRILETLERSNAFVSMVGANGAWHRYHVMFRELLRSQLRHRMPDAFAAQHRAAARWYARASLNVEATRPALAAGDWELAGDVLSAGWLELLVRGEAHDATALFEGFPAQAFARRPELAIAAAGALLGAGELARGEEYLRMADDVASALKPARRADFVFGRTIAQMFQARSRGRFADVRQLAQKLLAGHGSASASLAVRERRALALIHLGIADAWAGRRRHARASLEEALSLAGHAGRPYLGFSALGQLALLEAANGALRRATRFADEAVDLAERNGWMRRSASAAAHCALGVCAYHRNSMTQAGHFLDLAEEAARASRERTVAVVACVTRTRIALLRGDPDAAEAALREARDDAADWEMPLRLAGALSTAQAEAMVAAGRAADAVEWIDRPPALGRWGEAQLIRARLALAKGDPRRASELIADAVDGPASIMHPSSAIELRALGAVAMHQRGDDQTALELVEGALAVAEPEGFVSPFLAVGAPLRELLARRIRAGTAHRALAGELGEAMAPRSDANFEQHSALVLEPLSDREAVVLRYLPTGLSKAEIAAEMFVSVNTVKTHMKNIYRKLDVTDRGQAVRRARTLHLV
jgi:LuxR family transcriptional regulator, maltose regulon positive regulatory protein